MAMKLQNMASVENYTENKTASLALLPDKFGSLLGFSFNLTRTQQSSVGGLRRL